MNAGDIILSQLGVWTRGCLDIKGKYCRTSDKGLYITGCLVATGPNRRGNITIELTGADLYDVTLAPRTGRAETIEGMDVETMTSLLRRRAGL